MNNPDILQYIPQRPPFVMIDTLLKTEEKITVTSFLVQQGHLFVEDGYFTAAGLVENMAQTAAAGTGYKIRKEGKPPIVGYIGALKNLNILALPAVNDTIITEVVFMNYIMNVHIVQGRVYIGDKEIANCEMKIFLNNN